jgi:hypothetical protein
MKALVLVSLLVTGCASTPTIKQVNRSDDKVTVFYSDNTFHRVEQRETVYAVHPSPWLVNYERFGSMLEAVRECEKGSGSKYVYNKKSKTWECK